VCLSTRKKFFGVTFRTVKQVALHESIVEISGHIIDALILPKSLDLIVHLNNAKPNLAVIPHRWFSVQ
jgi:hypothetical protein